MNANEPITDDVEGHGYQPNANEPVAEDDVDGHGLLLNAAIAAALTVGGGVAMANPASADSNQKFYDAGCYDAYGRLDEECAATVARGEANESAASVVPGDVAFDQGAGGQVMSLSDMLLDKADAYASDVVPERLRGS